MSLRRALECVVLAAAAAAWARPAAAWDPATTHMGITDRAVLESLLHLRLMEHSNLERGLFTTLRIDPTGMPDRERRLVARAHGRAPEAAGARPLGGPGACPGRNAPPATRARCAEGDAWEASMLGWIRFGVAAELVPGARAMHHFFSGEDASAATWHTHAPPAAWVRRRLVWGNGAAFAGQATATGFDGTAPSAIAWLDDRADPLAPARLHQQLLAASLAPTRADRARHLALALIRLGALLHVAQDATVPAHARGDLTAFFAPLSPAPRDRGLALQEWTRIWYGQHALPVALALGARPAAEILDHETPTTSLRALVADAARFSAEHFLSEGAIGQAVAVGEDATAERAAQLVLASVALGDAERSGARLEPWPARSGYLVNAAGRPLAAFDRDEQGVRLYLDTVVYRDQARQAISRATRVSRAVIEHLFPAWPESTFSDDRGAITLALPAAYGPGILTVVAEDRSGRRRIVRRVALETDRASTLKGLAPKPGDRTVLVLETRRPSGDPLVIERLLPAPDPRPDPGLTLPGGPATAAGARPTAPVSPFSDPAPTPTAPTPAAPAPPPTPAPTPPPDPEPARAGSPR